MSANWLLHDPIIIVGEYIFYVFFKIQIRIFPGFLPCFIRFLEQCPVCHADSRYVCDSWLSCQNW